MKKLLSITLGLFISVQAQAQIEGSEIGFDLTVSASNFGGTVGLGLKYGFNLDDVFIAGPSVRYHRSWYNNATSGINGGYNIYGGGAFIHARFYKYFFVGTEFEVLHSPRYYGGSLTTQKWVPTWLFGGGFSILINDSFRFNAGIMYDVLDVPNYNNPNNKNPNSPLQPYIKVNQNKTVPILYRLSFFIPISG